MTDPSGSAAWTYDARGRVTQESKVINGTGGGTFVTQWQYDAMDRPVWMKYPGGSAGQIGEQVTFTYNAAALLNTVAGSSTYVQGTTYDALGRVEARNLGWNGSTYVLQTDYVYFPWTQVNGQGRLQQIKTGIPSNATSLQNLSYTYDAVGNVLTIVDAKAGGTQTQSFSYDALDRLKTAQATGGTGGTYVQETYTYTAIGNLLSKAGVTYTYPAPAPATGCSAGTPTIKPHAVSQVGSYTFTYDCNGNMLTRTESGGTYNQTWDTENRLSGISGAASATFVYDGDGNRVKATVNGVTTVYIGNYYEQNGTAIKKYYYAGGQRVALRDGSTLYFLLGDHLGSTAVTANASGGLQAELRYRPWGETRYTSGTTPTTYRFTGQREEVGLGSLYFYQARFYSPALGRFLSADTLVPEPGNPQSLNRYSYVNNNPLKYIDPSGHRTCSAQQAATGDETCSQNYPAETREDDNLAYYLARAEALEYYWDNFNPPYQGNPPLTSAFGPGHPDGVDWGGQFTVFAPAPGRVTAAGVDSPAGMWRIRNRVTGEIREWSVRNGNALRVRDVGRDGLLEPVRLLATGLWDDLEPGWSHTRGTIINIDHGHNLQTRYYHVDIDNSIRVGVTVDQGDVLADTTNNGWSTGTHLHFGVLFTYAGRTEWLNPIRPTVSRGDVQ